MAGNRCQWRSCCQFPVCLSGWRCRHLSARYPPSSTLFSFHSRRIQASKRWHFTSRHLRRRVLFSVPPSAWRKPRGGQHMTWQKGLKEITKILGVVGVVYLPGWGPRDPVCAWLET
ncbi:hypothetical protein T265_00094 [Opisthorchis viverrini]|uniref:Uncharacterized protein n=1 Tax=Opisthorchis viverrini TaxID=6198 RepID=A0A075A7A6_OPIVI|nr:hypothetical protein T265_00094 [Opisthorchis viverrini]KER34242.1 hypothetical protein T265_00094 [Opisthorchis viverrini]